MTMLWARHGKTALNATRVLPPADTALNATGLGPLQRPDNTSLTGRSATPPHDATRVACAAHLALRISPAPGAVA